MEKTKTNSIARTTEKAVNNPKKTMYLVGGLVALLVGYRIYKAFNPSIDDTVNNVGNGSISNATISQNTAANYAQQLLDAMNVNRNSIFLSGTDEKVISDVFDKIKNSDDFRLLFKAFGNKHYNGQNSPVEGLEILQTYQLRNLVYWLRSELNSFWDYSVYKKVKTVVEKAGFTF